MTAPVPRLGGTMVDIYRLLNPAQRVHFAAVSVGMLIAAGLEMIAASSIPIYLSIIVAPENPSDLFDFLPISRWIAGYDTADIVLWGAVMLVGIYVVKNVFMSLVVFYSGWILKLVATDVAGRLFNAYMRSAYIMHLQRNPAESIRNLTTEMELLRHLMYVLTMALRETVVMVLIVLAMFLADPVISICTIVVLGLTAGTFFVTIRRFMVRSGQRLLRFKTEQLRRINQSLGALRIARVLGHEAHLMSAFAGDTDGKETQYFYQRFLTAMPRQFLEIVAISVVLVIVLLFALLDRPPQEILPILALISVSLVRLVPVITLMTSALTQLQGGKVAVAAIVDDLHSFEAADQSHGAQSIDGTGRSNAFSELKVDDLKFTFPSADKPVVDGVSMRIAKGQSIGVIGPSGSGKSTLVDLLMGLLAPQSGSVKLDDRDLHQDRAALAGVYGYIPQDIYLLDDTIAQNIGFGLPPDQIDIEKVRKALEDAQMLEFVSSLPNGLDTVIGDRGARLSGGQRQRLGIARALYHDPAILVLDEATSALDGETEAAVIEAISTLKGRVTMITIAHRLSTIEDCVLIYRLDKGRIVAQGTYAEVVSTVDDNA